MARRFATGPADISPARRWALGCGRRRTGDSPTACLPAGIGPDQKARLVDRRAAVPAYGEVVGYIACAALDGEMAVGHCEGAIRHGDWAPFVQPLSAATSTWPAAAPGRRLRRRSRRRGSRSRGSSHRLRRSPLSEHLARGSWSRGSYHRLRKSPLSEPAAAPGRRRKQRRTVAAIDRTVLPCAGAADMPLVLSSGCGERW